ncbi:MAG: type II toxin-antitoxin system RelE/ParE family toxin [Candidatus Sumerlaeaceae bacterium]|nr:type II toxin-antitoxin system RelE/ParE family toxin [Candidatus Sumerlaeaceae bacterium]
MKVVLDPAAMAEMMDAACFYEEARVGLGVTFLATIEEAFKKVGHKPRLWPRLKGPFRRCLITGFPYGIIYRVDLDSVYVAAIMHLKRKPDYWTRRTKNTE